MKIAFVSQPSHSVLPPTGSLEIWTREVARRLGERHEVVLYASATEEIGDCTRDGIEYRFVDHSVDATLAYARALWRLRPANKAFFSSTSTRSPTGSRSRSTSSGVGWTLCTSTTTRRRCR